MTGGYESLEKVLKTIEAEKDLNLNNIIEKIKTELEEHDQGLYKNWEEGKFDVNYVFSLFFCECTLLTIAAENGYTNIVNVLLEKEVVVDERDHSGNTVLHLAAKNGHVDVVKVLLEKGANVDEKGWRDATPLHFAARNGHASVVEVLLKAEANVNAVDIEGWTPLHFAALHGRANIVEVLLKEEEANVNAVNSERRTPLHFAAGNGHKKTVEVLLKEEEANVNAVDIEGWTVLHLAAKNGYVDVVKVLLEKGANVNEKGWRDATPLHFAARNGHASVVEVLLKAEANINAVDRYGKTPLDYAEGYAKNQDVVKALLDARGGSFVKARNKAMIAGGVNTLLGTAIAVALFTTGTITAQLIPIVIAVVAVTAAALVVGCATYELLKPSTKVDGAEKPIVNSINEQQRVTSISSY
ncbi:MULTISPECIES: ankyrin repeat domain-containing protein [unclassified Wolbachia]|uniref:ankyrin repeat domain-containing protein n=1 Tax=unclassified Wolbachia TaxID=2640676 RepID=UPI002231BE3F|nr:ankyrin repeat domain-containing protein [Wolbachia endosymbiont (group B) of Thymelicus sylvestris]